jgi:hypothetical protein
MMSSPDYSAAAPPLAGFVDGDYGRAGKQETQVACAWLDCTGTVIGATAARA